MGSYPDLGAACCAAILFDPVNPVNVLVVVLLILFNPVRSC
jgi:hypothetical protein